MKNSAILLTFAASVTCGMAQTISTGPVTGNVFDTVSHAIRPILGVPGAAFLGGSAASSWELAAASPDGAKALCVRGGQAYFIPDLSQPDVATAIGSVIDTVDRIVWSGDSNTAAVFSSRSGELQRITGLGGSPAIGNAVQPGAAGEVAAWKIGPDGNSIAYAVSAADSGSVYVISGSAPAARLGDFRDPRALAFSPDGSSLFVFDRASGQIVQLQVSSGAVLGSFAAALNAPDTPSAAASTPGLRRRMPPRAAPKPDIADLAVISSGAVLIAARGGSLCSYDLTGQNPAACSALEINAASIDAISPRFFVLNYARESGSPVWLWDASASEAFFVPSAKGIDAAK